MKNIHINKALEDYLNPGEQQSDFLLENYKFSMFSLLKDELFFTSILSKCLGFLKTTVCILYSKTGSKKSGVQSIASLSIYLDKLCMMLNSKLSQLFENYLLTTNKYIFNINLVSYVALFLIPNKTISFIFYC